MIDLNYLSFLKCKIQSNILYRRAYCIWKT